MEEGEGGEGRGQLTRGGRKGRGLLIRGRKRENGGERGWKGSGKEFGRSRDE